MKATPLSRKTDGSINTSTQLKQSTVFEAPTCLFLKRFNLILTIFRDIFRSLFAIN